jgi:seryl-tRNA synthetase
MAMFGQFFRWLFGIKEKDEESSIENNTSDVKKEPHGQVHKLKTDVRQLKKEIKTQKERSDISEQTLRNLNSRLSDLEDADEKNNTDESVIKINPHKKETRKKKLDTKELLKAIIEKKAKAKAKKPKIDNDSML